MAVYGPITGTAFGPSWTNIANSTASDGNYATLTQTETGPSEYATLSFDPVAIGGGETLTGMKLLWKGYCSEVNVEAVAELYSFDGEFYSYVSTRIINAAGNKLPTSDELTSFLVRKAQYRVSTTRFACNDVVITVPDSGTANLADLIAGARAL